MSFIAFNAAMTNRIAAGSIKNVLLFGNSFGRHAPPYAVIRPMAGGGRKLYQVTAHMEPGMHEALEEYIFRELPRLLKEPLEEGGKHITAKSTGGWHGPYVDEGDNTLAMSRDFYVPAII